MAMRMSKSPDEFRGRGELDTHSVVYGLRNFSVDTMFRLTGVMYKKAVWLPGENKARCYRSSPGAQPPPKGFDPDHSMLTCMHGFYAYYDGSRDYHDRGDVTGIIKGWGEGLIGSKGFRVMRAEIVAIKFSGSIPGMARDRIRRAYPDIPVFTTVDRMIESFPLSANDLEYVPEADDDFWTREVS